MQFMRLYPDSWWVEVPEEEAKILDYLDAAIKNAGYESQLLNQGTGMRYPLNEFKITGLGEIYVYFVQDTDRTALEIEMDERTREGFRQILREFVKIFPRKPYGFLEFEMKRRWDDILK